jgi:2-C-methyl-D-erythritol 2,4-cyclodiphosphate synthase
LCWSHWLLLRLQVKKMKEAGYVLGNLDATIIAQKPKLSPHKVSIRYGVEVHAGASQYSNRLCAFHSI